MPTLQATLNAFFPPDFEPEGRVLFDVRAPGALPWGPRTVEIHDARALQAKAPSEAAFFARYGFVLLRHETAVRDWSYPPETGNDSEVARVYFPEIEALIRQRLLPGRAVEVRQPSPPLRRGRDTATPHYGAGVHLDAGLTPDDYAETVEAFGSPEAAAGWRRGYEREVVEGFMTIDFWRTTNMRGPLEHMPLALCDPESVEPADVVAAGMLNFTRTGKPTNQLALRFNDGQRWWYYPRMRDDEVLAFKLFHHMKSDRRPVVRSCFHAAFEDPTASADAEPRQSCEHRVGVFLLRS